MSARATLWVAIVAGAVLLGYWFAYQHHWLVVRVAVWGLLALVLLLVFSYPRATPRSR